MDLDTPVLGWQIRHQERLSFRARTGSPSISIRFYTYPPYRQEIKVLHTPESCKLKRKGLNAYYAFQRKMGTRGKISLEREIIVRPSLSYISLNDDWGRISSLDPSLSLKYREPSMNWPIASPLINETRQLKWFNEDDLVSWIKAIAFHINSQISERIALPSRLGAIKALRTGRGDCDEFTDLFVTYARARGIPARRLTGFAITRSDLTPHAWAEVFSPTFGWIPVDLARNVIGRHSIEYAILKIEEFSSDISDYQASAQHTSDVKFHWEYPNPIATPIE
ncbi:MAG: transglutaminase-like domain-containing protein [Candidatus Thorarchaeota archaeon]